LLKGYAYDTVTPFSAATIYDIKKARGSLNYLSIDNKDLMDGHVVVKLTAPCEQYSSILEGKNPRTGEWQPINVINSVRDAGNYECKSPSFSHAWEKRLENPHGLFEVL